MGSSMFSGVLFLIIVAFGIGFYFINKKNMAEGNTSSANKQPSESKDKKEEIKKDDIFKFMEFDKIQDDMIVQNKGQKYTMAIKCKGINYDLMSEVEQMAVEEGFITFLNTLKYPIQLYVQAQNIDLKGAINTYKENISNIKNEFEVVDAKYNKVLEAFDSTQAEIDEAEKKRDEVLNVYEYANDIISYVEKMSMNKNLLQRSFYVLVSYHTSEINATDKFSKDEIRNICYSELYTRAQGIISALGTCSVEGKLLNSNELADLLYNAYNRDDRGLMNVKEAIDSGFYRLYSTSKDAFAKKAELLDKEIENNAKLKAYQAIKETIEDGSYVSPKMEALQIEEDTSRLANEIIKRENVPYEVKEAAQKKVINDYREIKKEVLEQVKEEKETLLKTANKELGIKTEVDSKDKQIEESKLDNTIQVNKQSVQTDVSSSENDSIV